MRCMSLQGLCLFPEDTNFGGAVDCPVSSLARAAGSDHRAVSGDVVLNR